MIEREIDLKTDDGVMKTFIYHPEHDGPHPLVLFMMDAPSIRPALFEMASRLATAGYYVMMPFLFYRGSEFKVFGEEDAEMHHRRELMGSINPTNVLGDAEAMLDYAADDPNADEGDIGAVGYCMSGGLVVSIARAMPDRVAAVASIHGAWMVKDTPDSPHLNLDTVRAEIYLGWADNDATAPPEQMHEYTQCLDEADVHYELDFLTEAVHGYAPPYGNNYNREASELHWERIHSLFRRNLG
jgi:carboxymethylenebutenolidase